MTMRRGLGAGAASAARSRMASDNPRASVRVAGSRASHQPPGLGDRKSEIDVNQAC